MENVFDYNMTENERNKLIGSNISKDEYIKEADEDRITLDLFYLFMGRRNYEKAKNYLARFKDKEYRSSTFRYYWGDIIPDNADEFHDEMDKAYEIFKDIL